jgi:hypothetical protein
MKPVDEKARIVARRFWFVVGGGVISVAGLWVFAFTVYKMPETTSGVDGLVHGPLLIAAVMGCVLGAACEYFLERRTKTK